MKVEIADRFPPFEKHVIAVIEEKFKNLAKDCEYGFYDTEGKLNCRYHSSAVGYCEPELCPRLRSEQSERDGTRKVIKRKEDKLIEGIRQQ